jgi:hypothetical protein
MDLTNVMYPRDAQIKLGLHTFINGRRLCTWLVLLAVIGAFGLLILPSTGWAQYFEPYVYLYGVYVVFVAIALWFCMYQYIDIHKLHGLYNCKAWGEERLVYMVDRICEADLKNEVRLKLLQLYLELLPRSPSTTEHLLELNPKTRVVLDNIVQEHIGLMSKKIATIHSAPVPPESVGETQSLADKMETMMSLRRTLKPLKPTVANAPFGE